MNDYPSRTIGEPPMHTMLRRRRQELKLLQADVAEALALTPEAVTLWESGRRRMELSKIQRVARALQLNPKDLCFRALQEYHPAFYATIFGPRDSIQTNIGPTISTPYTVRAAAVSVTAQNRS